MKRLLLALPLLTACDPPDDEGLDTTSTTAACTPEGDRTLWPCSAIEGGGCWCGVGCNADYPQPPCEVAIVEACAP